MKYDFSKCNNLQFRAKDEDGKVREGFLKVANCGIVYLYYSDKRPYFNPDLQFEYPLHTKMFSNTTCFGVWAENHELEIVPRDPETYTDWKVGDHISHKGAGCNYHIAAKLGDIVFLIAETKIDTKPVIATTGLLTKYYNLILTDYEKELIHAQESEKKKECPFNYGDKVLVRDSDTSWRFDIFQNYEENAHYSYECSGSEYEQCIPLNEHTWKLLGTTDEHKEEE